MKTFAALVVIFCSVGLSAGIFKSLSPKITAAALFQPVSSYRTVGILASPAAALESVSVPALYSRPISGFTAQFSTYGLPSYRAPVSTYSALPAYRVQVPSYVASYGAAVPIYSRPAIYRGLTYFSYNAPLAAYAEDFPLLDESVSEEYYSRYGKTLKH